MADGHQRLNAVFQALVNQALIKCQTSLAGNIIVAIRQDTGPGDGKTIDLESHLGKQGNIFFVMVVHINRFMGRIGVGRIAGEHFHLSSGYLHPIRAERDYVYTAQAASALLIRTLALVGSRRAAPKEVVRKFTHRHSSKLFFSETQPC